MGTTPCILGKAVDCTYHRGPSYLEVIDRGFLQFRELRKLLTYWHFSNVPNEVFLFKMK